MKLIAKPVRKITGDLRSVKSIQDRIDWVRCVLGYSVTEFARRVGASKSGMRNVLESDSEPSLRIIGNISALFPIDRAWLLLGRGEPITKEDISEYIYSPEYNNQHSSEDVDKPIVDRIIEVRTEKGLSQVLFANEMGVSRDIISAIESMRTNPSVMFIVRLCKKYGINPNWLLLDMGSKYLITGKGRVK